MLFGLSSQNPTNIEQHQKNGQAGGRLNMSYCAQIFTFGSDVVLNTSKLDFYD